MWRGGKPRKWIKTKTKRKKSEFQSSRILGYVCETYTLWWLFHHWNWWIVWSLPKKKNSWNSWMQIVLFADKNFSPFFFVDFFLLFLFTVVSSSSLSSSSGFSIVICISFLSFPIGIHRFAQSYRWRWLFLFWIFLFVVVVFFCWRENSIKFDMPQLKIFGCWKYNNFFFSAPLFHRNDALFQPVTFCVCFRYALLVCICTLTEKFVR